MIVQKVVMSRESKLKENEFYPGLLNWVHFSPRLSICVFLELSFVIFITSSQFLSWVMSPVMDRIPPMVVSETLELRLRSDGVPFQLRTTFSISELVVLPLLDIIYLRVSWRLLLSLGWCSFHSIYVRLSLFSPLSLSSLSCPFVT